MRRLSGYDAMHLYVETNRQVSQVGSLMIVDVTSFSGIGVAKRFTEEIGKRINYVPVLKERLHFPAIAIDRPLWVEDDCFKIDQHVIAHTLKPNEELLQFCADRLAEPLPRDRPLWKVWVIEGGPNPDEVAVFWIQHHSMMDAAAAGQLMVALSVESVEQLDRMGTVRMGSRDDDVDDGFANVLYDGCKRFIKRIIQLPQLLGTTISASMESNFSRTNEPRPPGAFNGAKTSVNQTLSTDRRMAIIKLEMNEVKEICHSFNVTVNDLFLACVGGGFQHLFKSRNEILNKPIIAMVPVAMTLTDKSNYATKGTNSTGGLYVNLRIDIENPINRLSEIALFTRTAKLEHKSRAKNLSRSWMEYVPGWTLRLIIKLTEKFNLASKGSPIFNVMVSNVPGPPVKLFFWGSEVKSMTAFGTLFHGAGIMIAAISYEGKFNIGIVSCGSQLNDPSIFTDAFYTEYEKIKKAANLLKETK